MVLEDPFPKLKIMVADFFVVPEDSSVQNAAKCSVSCKMAGEAIYTTAQLQPYAYAQPYH